VTELGLLFDCDGVLVDSHGVVEHAWTLWGQEFGVDHKDLFAHLHGRPAAATVAHFVGERDRSRAQDWIDSLELELAHQVPEIPGARALLSSLDPSTWVVATSGGRELTLRKLRAAGLPEPRGLVTAEDVSRGKPDPEPYLLAASLLGRPASECAVFEDSVAGLQAARAAGVAVVVGVGGPAHDSGLADHAVTDLTEVPDLLLRLGIRR
jgi:sugar-phosphatase